MVTSQKMKRRQVAGWLALALGAYWAQLLWASRQLSFPEPAVAKLAISPSPTSPVPATPLPAKRLVVYLYDVVDSKFNLTHSGFSSLDLADLAEGVSQIWREATLGKLELEFRRRSKVLTPDQQLAHLFYVLGHPRIPPNRKQTHLALSSTQWVQDLYATQLQACETVWPQVTAKLALSPLPMSRSLFESKFPALTNAFPCLVGSLDDSITAESWHDVLFVKSKPISVQRAHMAFRLFYLQAGLDVKRTVEFAAVMQTKPMLFLHYAIGRDVASALGGFQVDRPAWEFANTLSVFPVPFYHDMNGRGSTHWMDVVFRTSSCFENRMHVNWGGDKLPVQCRWGTRKWERHEYTKTEFARMVAHEIGHCLGLEHFQPRCHVFSDRGNLMQQQRVFALDKWTHKCSCLLPSCADCGCELDEDTFRQVSLATMLTAEQAQLALEHAAAREDLL